jgi:hypothetical protein
MPPKKATAEPKAHMVIKTRTTTKFRSPTSERVRSRRYRASAKPEKSVEAAIDFFRRRVLVNDALTTAPDGPYTWILKQLPDESLMFAAGRTVSHQEIGTLHANLDAFTPPAPVIAAGELAKTETAVAFNLLSGTYMEKPFKRIKDAEERRRRQQELLQIVADYLKSLGFEEVAFLEAPEGTDPEKALGGAPILDSHEIITRLSEIAEYNRYLSGSNVTNAAESDA